MALTSLFLGKDATSVLSTAVARGVLYTVPTGKTAIVKEILLVVRAAVIDQWIVLYVLKSGGTDDTTTGAIAVNNDAVPIMTQAGLNQSTPILTVLARNLVLAAGDAIKLKTWNNSGGTLVNNLSIAISGDET